MSLRTLLILAALVALTGCQAISQHNAQTKADLAAGQAREAIKGITPATKETP